MQTYNINAGTFSDGDTNMLFDVAIAPELFKLDHLGEYDDLARHVAGILQADAPKDCLMHRMLGDVANGCCSTESRDDLTDTDAVPGTMTLVFYLDTDCVYDNDSECSLAVAAGNDAACDCEGDIMVVTVTPAI